METWGPIPAGWDVTYTTDLTRPQWILWTAAGPWVTQHYEVLEHEQMLHKKRYGYVPTVTRVEPSYGGEAARQWRSTRRVVVAEPYFRCPCCYARHCVRERQGAA